MTQTTYTATRLSPGEDAAFEEGLAAMRASGGGEHRLLIGGDWRDGGGRFAEHNPAHTDELLGHFAEAAPADVDEAVDAARSAQRAWARTPVGDRIAIFERVSAGIDRRAGELAATLTLEVGKNRLESMGEVAEAGALIRYYSRQAAAGFDIALERPNPEDENVSVMRPFGVFGLIAPFNFPLALVLGPSTGALLAGNTVVAKPSPTTSRVAVMFAEVLLEAGLPPGAFNLITGGDAAGRALVQSKIDGIVFTGSYAVGQQIVSEFHRAAGYVRPAIIEMGGKNPAIVTANADLDKAAGGIVRSAFGLSGQKCSACSRVLVDASVADELAEALVERARALVVSDPADPDCSLGPVHTAESLARFERAVADAEADGQVVHGGAVLADGGLADGYYAEPTIVMGLPHGHRLLREEQFVPLVAVERTASLEESLERANDQVYGLTAGIFSEDAAEVEAALEGIEAGTVFVNRAAGATTGGWPGQQSYPGWKGSGSTNRGGLGPRYVAQFLREQGRNIVH